MREGGEGEGRGKGGEGEGEREREGGRREDCIQSHTLATVRVWRIMIGFLSLCYASNV